MAQELVLVPKEKYQKLTQTENHPPKSMETILEPTKDPPTDKDIPTQMHVPEILEHVIPNKFHNKAKGLLKFLSQYGGDVLSWKDNGNLIYKDNVIEGSHITDLIKHALTHNSRGTPTGYRQFYEALKDIQTPTSFIHNKEMMKHSGEQTGSGLVVKKHTNGAPPNYNPPKRKRLTKTKIKWLKF